MNRWLTGGRARDNHVGRARIDAQVAALRGWARANGIPWNDAAAKASEFGAGR